MKYTGYFDQCICCKKMLNKKLEPYTATPIFIISDNVKKETEEFTDIYHWKYGTENKEDYIERVCNVMNACK